MKKQKFDFKAARQRIEELKLIYRQLKHTQEQDGTWDWWIMAEIDELEREIEMAHKQELRQDINNVVRPMVAAWGLT